VHSNSKDTKEVGSPPFIEKTTPVPNYVKFEVINGFAVAYGDILLGVPEQDVKEGVCHPPIPVLWKSKNIPYLIHPDLKNKEAVESAIDYFNRNTSIRFIPYSEFSSPPEDTILFEPMPLLEEHCLSYLGHIGGIQPIQLGKDCKKQEILHELMHALGFIHEQSRTDRGSYIDILWDHIEKKYQPQFEIAPDSFTELVRGFGFDYHSVMLYSEYSFSINPGLPTLKSLTEQKILPEKNGLSEMDLKKIYHLYP
jgi:hypothetical protein